MKNNQKIIIAGLLVVAIIVYMYKDTIFTKWGWEKFTDPEAGTFDFDHASLNIYGCMDSSAENYNPIANVQGNRENGCVYTWGCCDINAENFDASADSCWLPENTNMLCDYGAGFGVSGQGTSNSIAVWGETYQMNSGGVSTSYPNDCTCANLGGWLALGCMMSNEAGEVLDDPVCIGNIEGAQYCNSAVWGDSCNDDLPSG